MRLEPANHRIILFSIITSIFIIFVILEHQARSTNLSSIDHGDTLAEVMEGIRQEDFEITAAFTADGKKLFEYTNYEDLTVEISDAHVRLIKQYNNLIFLHNHPVWDQASFSSLDLEKLAGYQAGCGIIVSKNDTYVLFANNGWPSGPELSQFIRDRPEMTETIWYKGSDGQSKDLSVTTRRLMELLAAEYDLSYYEWSRSEVSAEEIAQAVLSN